MLNGVGRNDRGERKKMTRTKKDGRNDAVKSDASEGISICISMLERLRVIDDDFRLRRL